MFVGGEFYYDGKWVTNQPSMATGNMLFLNGGRACLKVICDDLLDHAVQTILLPSYLCPSILQTLETGGLVYDFYLVNEDLSIDLDDLAQKISRYPAVYFINYFGFLHNERTICLLKEYQHQGGLVVEDNAQAGFHNHPTGDFIFNSLRKFVPYDGGYLITQRDVQPYLNQYAGLPNRRLPVIRAYREQLYEYLWRDLGDYETLDQSFNLAEHYYEIDTVVLGDAQEREHIERLDWAGIKQARRDNYQYLLRRIAAIPELSPIFPHLQPDNMPMGLPVYVRDVSRDAVNDELGEHEIGLTIHWQEILDHPQARRNSLAVQMASRIITLPIDQRTSLRQLDYLAVNLKRAIARTRSHL